MTLPNAVVAGMRLFGLVFIAGFAFGVIRETGLTPVIGATAARLAELPLMIAISFFRRGGFCMAVSTESLLGLSQWAWSPSCF